MIAQGFLLHIAKVCGATVVTNLATGCCTVMVHLLGCPCSSSAMAGVAIESTCDRCGNMISWFGFGALSTLRYIRTVVTSVAAG